MKSTPEQVAEWMFQELRREKYLDQESAVSDIETKFGSRFTYENENGNSAIDRKVLAAFRKITGDKVVWDRGERQWRFREVGDSKGRQQD